MYGKLRKFLVYLNGKVIDKVFYSEWSSEKIADIRMSLINHDNYDPNIKVIEEK